MKFNGLKRRSEHLNMHSKSSTSLTPRFVNTPKKDVTL